MKAATTFVCLMLAGSQAFVLTPMKEHNGALQLAMTKDPTMGRREAFTSMISGGAAASLLVPPVIVNALDLDAFVNSELDEDTKNCDPKKDPKCAPKMSEDEALCKYGQNGEARGEACKRFRKQGGTLPSTKPEGKSLGGAYAI